MNVPADPVTGEVSEPTEIVPGLATLAPSTYSVNWLVATLAPEDADHVPTRWCQLLSFNADVPSTPIKRPFESSPNKGFPEGLGSPENEPQVEPQAPMPSRPKVREWPAPVPRSCTTTEAFVEGVLTHASME